MQATQAKALFLCYFQDGSVYQHVTALASKTQTLEAWICEREGAEEYQLLLASVWLHDIGKARALHASGFHPLDGALYLDALGVQSRLVGLVAHHSGARLQLTGSKLLALDAFPREPSSIARYLDALDMSTGPHGEEWSLAVRMQDIQTRYGEASSEYQAALHILPECRKTLEKMPESSA